MSEKKTPEIRFREFEDEWTESLLDQIIETEPFKLYLKEPSNIGNYIVIQQGNEPIAGFANGEPCNHFEKVVLFGDHTLSLYKPTEPFFIASDGLKILMSRRVERSFLYCALEKYKPKSEGYKRHFTILQDIMSFYPLNESEQKRIGSLFSALDRLIDRQRRKLEKLQTFKQAMLEKMFPKEGSLVPEIRFRGFQGEWERCKLGDLVSIGNGRDYRHLKEGNVPVYGTGGLMCFVNEALSNSKDAIGIGRKGTIDKPFLLKAPFWTVDTLFYATPVPTQDLYFTLQLFNKVNWLQKVEATGVPSLTKVNINLTDTLTTTCAEQRKIGSFFEGLDSRILLFEKKLSKLQTLKQSLLQKMFV